MNLVDRRLDALMNAGLSAFYIVAGIVIVGRALNSQLVMGWGRLPILGAAFDAIRGVWNQVYDVSGQD